MESGREGDAARFYLRIKDWIAGAQRDCDAEHVLVVNLLTLAGPVSIRQIGYADPTLFVVYGIDSAQNECRILTHYNTAQLMLSFVPASDAPEGYHPIELAGNIDVLGGDPDE